MLLLGLGSNLSSSFGDRFENLDLATSYLEEYKIKIIKRSSFYETPSYPDIKNPKFINTSIESLVFGCAHLGATSCKGNKTKFL